MEVCGQSCGAAAGQPTSAGHAEPLRQPISLRNARKGAKAVMAVNTLQTAARKKELQSRIHTKRVRQKGSEMLLGLSETAPEDPQQAELSAFAEPEVPLGSQRSPSAEERGVGSMHAAAATICRVVCRSCAAPYHCWMDWAQGLHVYESYAEVEHDDKRRMDSLTLSRESDLVFGVTLLSNPVNIFSTVVPKLLIAPPTVLSVGSFAMAALLVRCEIVHMASSEYSDSALDGSSVLISFLISFYLGYCYNRYYAIYWACMACRNHVIECCALARLYLYDQEDVWRIWRYANLAHVSAMIGLSPVYTTDNLVGNCANHFPLLSTPPLHSTPPFHPPLLSSLPPTSQLLSTCLVAFCSHLSWSPCSCSISKQLPHPHPFAVAVHALRSRAMAL